MIKSVRYIDYLFCLTAYTVGGLFYYKYCNFLFYVLYSVKICIITVNKGTRMRNQKVLNVLVKMCCPHGEINDEFKEQCEQVKEKLKLYGWNTIIPGTVKVAFQKLKIDNTKNLHKVVVQHTRTMDIEGIEFLSILAHTIHDLDQKRQFIVQPFGSVQELKHHPEAIHYSFCKQK